MEGHDSTQIHLAIALVRNLQDEGFRWLATWNESKKVYDFVIGQRLGNESFRETVIRETAWALDLDRNKDFIVSNMAQANIELEGHMPGHSQELKIAAAFYNVEIYRANARRRIELGSNHAWLTSQEICAGVTEDQLRLNPIMTWLVEKSGAIRHWESSTEI